MYGSPYDLLGMGMGGGSLGVDPYSYLGMGMRPRNRLSRRDLLDMPYGYGYGRGRGSRYLDPYDILDDVYDDDYIDDYEDIEDPLLYHLRFGGRRRPRRRFGGRGYGRWGY